MASWTTATISLWQSHYRSRNALYTDGDANLDGIVDAADYTIWRDHLGFHTSPLGAGAGSSAAVPEPGGLATAFFPLVCLSVVCCRRRFATRLGGIGIL